MRYWKCIKPNEDYQSVTAGNIYKTYDNGLGLVDDKGYEFKSYTPPEFNAKFEEITYTDYILQEFVNEKIAIVLKNKEAVKYWREKLLLMCINRDITNIFNIDSSLEEDDMYEDRYYVKSKTVYMDEDYDRTYEVIILEEIKNEEENRKMEKEFTISDLKDGMIVETREGNLYLIHGNNLMNKNGETRLDVEDYNEDLTDDTGVARCDIMKIYNSNANVLKNMFAEEELKLIWERKNNNLTKEYKFGDITISPNEESYREDDNCDPIYIKKSDDWDDYSIAITVDEAEFLVESLKEIISNVKNK